MTVHRGLIRGEWELLKIRRLEILWLDEGRVPASGASSAIFWEDDAFVAGTAFISTYPEVERDERL
jgi:hypothetical protein